MQGLFQAITEQTVPAHIFREYDIRGTVGTELTPSLARALGSAFARFLAERSGRPASSLRLRTGYDSRLSSPALAAALTCGMREAGAEVPPPSLMPSPALYYAVKSAGADGGICVTGSHNPPEYNGFKCMGPELALHGADIARLRELILSAPPASPARAEDPGFVTDTDFLRRYAETLFSRPGTPKRGEGRPLRAAWDPGNGAAGVALRLLLPLLPGEHILVNAAPDGTFPDHHPDPGDPKNMARVSELTRAYGCDVGLALDGDGDRLGATDERGEPLTGDALTYLFASDCAARAGRGAKIIADVKTGSAFFRALAEEGADPIMSRTGHSLIKEKMRDVKAVFAGEASGHLFFADNDGFDDGLFAALRLLHIIAARGAPLSVVAARFPQEPFRSGERSYAFSDTAKHEVVARMQQRMREEGRLFSDIDGVRAEEPQGWWCARVSNTRPAVTVTAAAYSECALAEYLSLAERLLDVRNSATTT